MSPSSPGRYRIRREPDAQSLSTLEATVAALQALEPDTIGLEQLTAAFERMVDQQLQHPAGKTAWRRKQSRSSRPRHFPAALLDPAANLVVAYGETTPGQPGRRTNPPSPVNWLAVRLGSRESFSCRLRQEQPISDRALRHMRLPSADAEAVSLEEFRQQWSDFLRPHDVLIVYHQRTFQLLQNVGAVQPRYLVLKSVFGKWRNDFHSLTELAAAEGVSPISSPDASRASQRLATAVALVEHLRERYGQVGVVMRRQSVLKQDLDPLS